jgi:hypothetical protein
MLRTGEKRESAGEERIGGARWREAEVGGGLAPNPSSIPLDFLYQSGYKNDESGFLSRRFAGGDPFVSG